MDVLYFAWLRERVGLPRETIETSAPTVRALVAELAALDDWHAAALSDLSAVRVALDQELADLDSPLGQAREIAFFPPMTGG
ncbi:molybdopterin converting factor subunit 1 [Paracoccus aminophilus]|uniref:molybdopterin converting factor subunit 1 n=1 Tax=Paracoccus aminophilus TaxID=34003 RepID=UPI00191C458C|nr:molybdopterin converting factor subunit 1 [Paracoccus aminophilus]